ncbi:MAG: biotin/lipoyl-binding protein, partial [Candidatus Eremiobacteraeota bacterium]|nr:biotin/lipoyl-binding protein [Candidatus Eremiobacteraeota bacterium]
MRVIALVILALLCAGCRSEGRQERRARVAVVGVAHPTEAAPSQSHEYTGTVESLNQVAVVPQVAGQLESVEVSVGDSVEKGQLLAVVDDSQLEAQVNQARATAAAGQASVQTALANLAASRDQTRTQQQAVAQAEAQLIQSAAAVEKAQVQQRLALSNLKRIEEVAAKDLIATQVVDEARAESESAAADVKAANAQQTAVQGKLQQARSQVKTAAQQEKAAEAQVNTARA